MEKVKSFIIFKSDIIQLLGLEDQPILDKDNYEFRWIIRA